MKQLGWLAIAIACACGGGNKPAEQPHNEAPPAAAPAPTDEQAVAEAEAARVVKEARAAEDKVADIAVEMDALTPKMDDAITAVADAQNDADRQAAKARLVTLQKQKAELDQRMAQARAEAERAERAKGV